jgi:hypothetical protein
MNALVQLAKFGAGDEAGSVFSYPDVIHHDRASGGAERLILAPARGHIKLLSRLLECLPEPFRVLYVLVVPRGAGISAARYEAPGEFSRQEVKDCLAEFSDFFERDGRHHLWLANPEVGTIVYDRHNLIYAYGPLNCFTEIASRHGLRVGRPEVPSPHWHAYHAAFDDTQRDLLNRYTWVQKPLRASDEA